MSRDSMVQRGLRWRAGWYRGEERSADSLVRVFFWQQFQFARTRLSALLFAPSLESAMAKAGVVANIIDGELGMRVDMR